jgi:hypothetical protein
MSARARVARCMPVLWALWALWALPAAGGELDEAAAWCAAEGGEREVILYGGGRADCVTADYAVEVEYAANWAEALGQALWYAVLAERRAGIVLLTRPDQYRFVVRLESTIQAHGLDVRVWVVRPE